MTKKQAQQRIENLIKLINYHRYLYHVLDRQEISDSALDSLKKELFDLEQQFPEFITPDSPTQRIGGEPLEKFEKVRHPQQMLSFNDAFSQKDMEDWLERISKLLTPEEKSRVDFYCELKIDGIAIELFYANEILKTGSTRGDGIIGEDVTQNLKTIEAIPLRLRDFLEVKKELNKEGLNELTENLIKPYLVIRGEAFVSKKEFERINREQSKKGLASYANPRNIAAGSIRQLNPQITASRRLDSYAYDLIADLGQKIPRSPKATGMAAKGLATHSQKHKILKILGFKTNPHNRYCKNLNEVFEFHKFCQGLREKLCYEIDGIVVIVNDNKIFNKLGIVGKAPRGAIAFKFPLKQVATIVKNIKVQVGRTGALTPVAYLGPVRVGGVIISRATLHNEDEIKRLGIKIGDTVIVGRAGDVIPDIVKVLPELRTGKEKEFKMPAKCPACGSKVEKKEGEVVYRCVNPNCFAVLREEFYHFVSKRAFDVRGLGPKILDQLIEKGLVSDPIDIFNLKEGDILPLERFGEKSARKLILAIQKSKEIALPKLIYSLGIRNVGEETAQELAEHFGSLDNVTNKNLEELQKVKDIGPIVAKSIRNWFSQKRNNNLLEKIKRTGIKIKNPAYIKTSAGKQKLKGKIFVLTGRLITMAREEAKEKIHILGGDISGSVSKNTDFIIIGQEPGLKLEKAKKLGIKIISEEEFLKLIH